MWVPFPCRHGCQTGLMTHNFPFGNTDKREHGFRVACIQSYQII